MSSILFVQVEVAYREVRCLCGTLSVSGSKDSEHQEAGQDRLKSPCACEADTLIQPVCGPKSCSESRGVHLCMLCTLCE